jgi:hypothetical protein
MTTPYTHRASRLAKGLPRTGSPIGHSYNARLFEPAPIIKGVGGLLEGENLAEVVMREVKQRRAMFAINQSE